MATTKKSTTKKTTTKKAPAKRASSVRKAAPKKTATRVRVSKKQQPKSFKVAREQQKFMTFSPSVQTFYWIVLGVICVCFALWILKLQADINSIYDSIEMSSAQSEYTPEELKMIKEAEKKN